MNWVKKALLSSLMGGLRDLVSPTVKRIIAEEVVTRLEVEAGRTRNTWDDFFVKIIRRVVTEG